MQLLNRDINPTFITVQPNTDSKVDISLTTDFEKNSTRSMSNFYTLIMESSASTSYSPLGHQMYEEFLALCSEREVSHATEEESISKFIDDTKEWIEKFGSSAIDLIKLFIDSKRSSNYLNSEILEMLGDVDNQATYTERRLLLESYLNSGTLSEKYGSILGLGNLGSKESLGKLKGISEQMKNSELFEVVQSVIKILEK